MKRIAIATLGCRVNFDDSDQIAHQAAQEGFQSVPFQEIADLYVINSCTVTRAADSQTRKLARAARRRNPDSLVFVTGCSAEISPEALRAMPEIDLVLGNVEKPDFLQVLKEFEAGKIDSSHESSPVSKVKTLNAPLVSGSQLRQRPVLKVQDGCNHRCSFCVIPRARGRSRSLPVDSILNQLVQYTEAGVQEVVLSGVHLASYGRDLKEDIDLEALLTQIVALPKVPRLRLSSIEPVDLTEGVIDLIAERPDVFCRFLHMAVQSGSTAVLQRMKRRYTRDEFLNRTDYLLERLPGLGLGLDLLVGFPGETEEDFEETCSLVEALPVSHAHIFPYSERPQTGALALDGSVPVPIRKARARKLQAIANAKRLALHKSKLGQSFQGVAVRALTLAGGDPWLRVVTETGLEIDVPKTPSLDLGSLVPVRLVALEENRLLGEVTPGVSVASMPARPFAV